MGMIIMILLEILLYFRENYNINGLLGFKLFELLLGNYIFSFSIETIFCLKFFSDI